MNILIVLIILVSPLNADESNEVYLAMPHTVHIELTKKIGQLAKKSLQF